MGQLVLIFVISEGVHNMVSGEIDFKESLPDVVCGHKVYKEIR